MKNFLQAGVCALLVRQYAWAIWRSLVSFRDAAYRVMILISICEPNRMVPMV